MNDAIHYTVVYRLDEESERFPVIGRIIDHQACPLNELEIDGACRILNERESEKQACLRAMNEALLADPRGMLERQLFKAHKDMLQMAADAGQIALERQDADDRVVAQDQEIAELKRQMAQVCDERDFYKAELDTMPLKYEQIVNERLEAIKDRDALRAQIHDMCHDLHVKGPVTAEEFCDGCERFQITHFGSSPITKLRELLKLCPLLSTPRDRPYDALPEEEWVERAREEVLKL